jgi:hypothetical protein
MNSKPDGSVHVIIGDVTEDASLPFKMCYRSKPIADEMQFTGSPGA